MEKNSSHAVLNENNGNKSEINRSNVFCRKKRKAEGSLTFQTIFSPMANFRDVESVLSSSPTNKYNEGK